MNKRSSKMLINQDFSVDRTKYIGGSDIGAILGLSRYRTPLQVWMEKTGKDTSKPDSLPMRFGSFAEEFVASEYSRATGFELIHDESIYIHPTHSFMSAHIDRFVLPKINLSSAGNRTSDTKSTSVTSIDDDKSNPTLFSRILECKTANPFAKNEWGEAGTDHVPMSYLCQCIWYMAITGIDQTDLAVLFGNSDFRIYEITRDLELEELVTQKAEHFWHQYVLKDIPPPTNNEQDCQILFDKGDSTKTIQASQETLDLTKRLHFLNSAIATYEKEISGIKQVIMNQMGVAETLAFGDEVLATWRSPKPSNRLDAKKLELEHPALCANYKMPIQNSRRLVIKELSNSIETLSEGS
jgi:putative phage-type endonuclease